MNKRTRIFLELMAFGLFVSFLPTQLHAQANNYDAADTWKGEVIDMNCYLTKGSKGLKHAKCAKSCVKGGQPMGLLTEDGTLFLIGKDNKQPDVFESLKDKAGEEVKVSGKLAERDGMKMLIVSKKEES
ncbi:MAG: hypothetical protein AAF587_30480 [Bacteroidota bacterium]